jgi:hypothetical protein
MTPMFCQFLVHRGMRDDQRRQRLADANPWWRAVAGGQDPTACTGHHSVLKGRAAHDLGFRSGVLDDVQSGPVTDQLAVLTGPRRIGKSVALLDTAAALCARRDVDARQVIYLPCDGMAAQDAHRCLILDRELTRSIDRDQPHPRVWLHADVDPDRPQDSVPRLLDGISQRATSPLNITATSAALGYPSRDIFVRRPRGRPRPGHGPVYERPVPTVPLESKWVEQGWKCEARTIDAKFGRGILATKSVLDTTGGSWAVPAPLLALLLQDHAAPRAPLAGSVEPE